MVNDILPFDQPPPPTSIFEASWHPCLNVDSITVLHLFLCAVFPFLSATFYLFFRLVFGTLYPAYASYKAVKTKNVKEYVKWMMYWIVFALFTCLETIADIFISFWLPFYYELKILFVLWLMSPATKGSSILYRKFVHPAFTRRERDIDDYISKAKEQGYSTVLQMGSKGFSYATSVVMQTALRGQFTFVNQLRKSCSMSDISVDNKYEQLVESKSIQILDTDEEDQTGAEFSTKTLPQKRHRRLVKSMSSPEKFSEEEEEGMTSQEEEDDEDHSKQRKKHQARRRNTTNIPLPSENKEAQDSVGESSDNAIPSGSKLGRSKSLRVTSRKYTTHKESSM